MGFRTSILLLSAAATVYLSGCSSLSGSTRDAFAPFVELSRPETVDNVIVGGTNPYATSVQHSLAAPAPSLPAQTVGVFADSQATAQQMLYQTMLAQCGGIGTMSPIQFINGQWISTIQCGAGAGFPQ